MPNEFTEGWDKCKEERKRQIEELAKTIYTSLRSDTMSRALASLLYGEGYRKASEVRAETITEFAEKIKTFYHNLGGKTVGGSVAYHIEQIAKEMRG